ncbi:MAG: prohibitin family protein [Synechococcus sp. SB0668_bin_15]|nr:prohibitin family protein [Synechococcus sp. SB0668_bin_15]MXZ83503.1 prohibitin family protein [Synechococcus sp. SB0666_bin_14]MYA91203.1 prohibitin family protein [Synechococcus sp. SB0663_bin_10]MYC49271.1 prohibitin family protein [Synechococcus sp. SB0662_bin_14]MYG47704.1 prohibitin family protein [Synechococcus sp. SB0675_bin_6]MYJ60536.1 prohibitin family protein [Synechococcus sp. SB0672_bin_6]
MESEFHRVAQDKSKGDKGGSGGPGVPWFLMAGGLLLLLLLSQAVFIVPAGTVAVITTLGRVTGSPRGAGPNLKVPLFQSTHRFSVKTQVRPERFASLTKDLQVIEATATVKYALKPQEVGRVYAQIATFDGDVYPRIVQPSLLKALKSVFSRYDLVTIASQWGSISEEVEQQVDTELSRFGYVDVQGLDLTGLQIAEEYRAAIEEKQIAEQRLQRAQTEVRIAEEEAKKFQTLSQSLDEQVLYKLFLDRWDGKTSVVPNFPGGGSVPVIVDAQP